MATQLQERLEEVKGQKEDYKIVLLTLIAQLPADIVATKYLGLVRNAAKDGTIQTMYDLHRDILAAIEEQKRLKLIPTLGCNDFPS